MAGFCYLHQDQPEVDYAVTLATHAMQILTGEVDPTHCADQLAQLVGKFAPYRRRPTVRQLTEQVTGLLTTR